MELYWLEYFQKIAKYGGVSKAAEQIHISQPALSKTLSILEDELGVKLFDRVGRRLVLNKYGESFLGYVNTILNQIENARVEINNMRMDSARKLSICINTGNKYITNRMLDFMNDNPDLRVEFASMISDVHEIEHFDLIVNYSNALMPDKLDSVLLYDEEIVLLAAKRQFPDMGKSIRLADCADLSFSLPERNGRPDDLRMLYDQIFDKCRYSPKVIHQSTSVDQVRNQLLMGKCVTIVPYGITTIMDMNDINIIKIADFPISRQVRAYWPFAKGKTEDVSTLIDYLMTTDLEMQIKEMEK